MKNILSKITNFEFMSGRETFPNDLWVSDSGESFHTTGCLDGLFDLRRSNEDHFVGGGDGGKIPKIEFLWNSEDISYTKME